MRFTTAIGWLGLVLISGWLIIHGLDATGGHTPQKALRLDDVDYESGIRTVLFYPERQAANTDVMTPPILALGSSTPLVLEFDEMGTEYHNYYFKIIHCNVDWSKSMLADMEFLFEFNEYMTDRYTISSATRVPYVHYRLVLPKVKLSGNYVIKVYREGNEADLVLTRRFMVYTNRVALNPTVHFSQVTRFRDTDQQVDLTIGYRGLTIFNPRDELKVFIRQNYRSETMLALKPLYANEADQMLDYRFFDGENTFPGGNEFRTFDIRGIRSLGLHVASMDITTPQPKAVLQTDFSRAREPYAQIPDINGCFVVENAETKGTNIDPDYVWVTFSLAADEPYEGSVYVFGALSTWRKDLKYMMFYREELKQYMLTTQLKQGFYNYCYLLETPSFTARSEHAIEGSHSITNNNYEVFVYTRFIGMRHDELIGYRFINHLGRN